MFSRVMTFWRTGLRPAGSGCLQLAAVFCGGAALLASDNAFSPDSNSADSRFVDSDRAAEARVTHGAVRLTETDTAITMTQDGKTVLSYVKVSPPVPKGLDPALHRSGCLHPVMTPGGATVTAMFPADHPHQHGVFSAWVRTTWNNRDINFWDLAGGTGRVLHHRVVETVTNGDRVGFEVELLHRAEQEPVVDILSERWRVSVLPTDGTFHAFDLHTTQRALTDIPLTVQQYHYGGVAVRGPVAWVLQRDSNTPPPDSAAAPSRIITNLGSDRIAGNHEHVRWVSLTGSLNGHPATISVLCHHDNFRAPQAARLHPTKPYFVFAPCVDGEFVIDRDHPYVARYRCLLTDAEPDPAWLDVNWKRWHLEQPNTGQAAP